uniref:FCP1 homology domain-containing protein n=1 Tax=viral metagenome TaxID=1070528 RepID=A0A6C0F0A4_9ZZZZ
MAGLFSSSRGLTPANNTIAVADFDNTFAKHSGGKPVAIFEYNGITYTRYKDLMTREEIQQLAALIREFKGYGIPFHVVSWADEALLKQYLQHVLEQHVGAYNMITGIHGSFNQHYIPKSKTINSFRKDEKIIFIDDDEKNIDDVEKNVPGALAIKAKPGESSANMEALKVTALRDHQSLSYEGHMPGEVHVDKESPKEAPESKRRKTNEGGKSKSKRKTKSKRKSKRKTMKK